MFYWLILKQRLKERRTDLNFQMENQRESESDMEIENLSMEDDAIPDDYLTYVFGYDPLFERSTTSLHLRFFEAIKNGSECDFASCLDQMDSPADIAFASICCVLNDWPNALQKVIVNPAFIGYEFVHYKDPTKRFFDEFFGEKIAHISHLHHSSDLIEEAVQLTRMSRSYKCFELFMRERKRFEFFPLPIPFVSNVYKEVISESGEPKETLCLQNKFLEPIYQDLLVNGTDSTLFAFVAISIDNRNIDILEQVLKSRDAVQKLSVVPSHFQALATMASTAGLNDLAVALFERQTKKTPRSLNIFLKSATDSYNVLLIEKILEFYGDNCNFLVNESYIGSLFQLLASQGKQDLFLKAFPSISRGDVVLTTHLQPLR